MKNVYFYTDGIQKAHPVYQEASRYVPEGFQFIPSASDYFEKKATPVPTPKPSRLQSFVKKHESRVLNAMIALRIPKVRFIHPPMNTDIIHSGQYPLWSKTPWVMDFEQAAALAWFNRDVLDTFWTKRCFEYLFSQPSCKALIGWTEAAKTSLLNSLNCEKFQNKIHTVPFTIIPQEHVNRDFNKDRRVEILFCSGNFYYKGGLDAILAAETLAKNYNIHLTVVSQYPQEVEDRFKDEPWISFHKSIPSQERRGLMQKSDILLHPGHSETYGFVMLEAFSYGLPVITTDGYSGPEMVGEGSGSERGYAVKNFLSWFDEKLLPWVRTKQQEKDFLEGLKNPPADYIQALAKATAELLESPEKRRQMSENAYKSVTEGIFSPVARQKNMQKIYNNSFT